MVLTYLQFRILEFPVMSGFGMSGNWEFDFQTVWRKWCTTTFMIPTDPHQPETMYGD